jgi:hypothetical protein
MFDYELWMRLRFWMDLRPRVIEQSLGTDRVLPDSATSRKGAEFTREFLRIHAEYQSALSPWQRWCAVAMLVLLLPVGRAVQQHLAAFAAVGDGRRAAALGHLACSVLWFPPALFHLRTWSVLRACLRGPHPRPRPAVAPSAVEGGFVN